MAQPTLYDNFERVKNWSIEKFADKQQLANTLADVAFSGNYNDLLNRPDLNVYTTYAYVNSYVADAIAKLPGTDLSDYTTYAYVTTYVSGAIANLVGSAPSTLDTLKELANALGDDPNFATTITTELGTKANSSDVYSKTDIQNMSYVSTKVLSECGYITSIPSEYITETELSACGYITSIPSEYITDSELSACGYATALTQVQMDTLFPINS